MSRQLDNQRQSHALRCAVRTALLVVVCAATAACGSRHKVIALAGATAFEPAAEKLVPRFLATHPDLSVNVQFLGSAVGVQAALSGAADIGVADFVSLPTNAAALTSAVVARDGIAIVVHPTNGVTALTVAQVRAIFAGQTRSWRAVGGADRAIHVVCRQEGSGTRTAFDELVGVVEASGDAVVQDSTAAVRETVANDPDAIAYMSCAAENPRVKAVDIDGVACTAGEVAAGRYPLSRPIRFLTRGPPSGPVAEFIQFALSPEGQAIIRASGLIPSSGHP